MRTVACFSIGVLLLGLAAAPAVAGGWGGRYGVHHEEGGGYSSGGFQEGRRWSGEADQGGYHRWGGAVLHDEHAESAWRYRRLEEGGGPSCWTPRMGAPVRGLPACGQLEVTLPGDFFVGGGGVGGFPEMVDYGGGGGGFVFAGAGARASAFASASARVSVSFRGGGHRTGHKMGHGCGCK